MKIERLFVVYHTGNPDYGPDDHDRDDRLDQVPFPAVHVVQEDKAMTDQDKQLRELVFECRMVHHDTEVHDLVLGDAAYTALGREWEAIHVVLERLEAAERRVALLEKELGEDRVEELDGNDDY